MACKFCFLILSFFTICISAQYEDTGNRGSYYSKKYYTENDIPDYSSSRNQLPSPVLEDKPEYVKLYWKAWELAFQHYKKPPSGSPFVSNFIDEAFSQSIFQWDTIFMIMFARYADHIFPAIQSLDNFYCRQYENGYICREIVESDGSDYVYMGRENTVNPPLFSWAEVESYRITGDKSRFKAVIPVLENYIEWLEKYRRKSATIHGLYWQTGLGSGMDNTPRNGSGWVDMSSQMVMMYRDLSFMCNETGLIDKAQVFSEKAKSISSLINKFMWNEDDGIYFDVDDNGNQVKWKTVAGFWPMLAGVSNTHQNEKMFDNLFDASSFWRLIPFPSLAADQAGYKAAGEYWVGGVWAPTNVMIIKGLDKVGEDKNYENPNFFKNQKVFNEFATLATEKYLDGMYEVYKRTGTIWENYSPDAFSRAMPSAPDFVGWSGCGPIQLLIENILGFRPDGANQKLIFNLNRIDKHGIEGLRFGDINASVICERRESVNSEATIHVSSNQKFELVVVGKNGEKSFSIPAGESTVTY